MSLASLRDSTILATLFLRRGRAVNRTSVLITGAVAAAALCGLLGLTQLLGHVSRAADARNLGAQQANGCIQGSYRFDPLSLEQYENLILSSTCPTPAIPPGLDRFPQPGQTYLSPALADLRKTEARIEDRYPVVTGLIDRAGLTGSNELRAIVGVEPQDAGALGVVAFNEFGSTDSDYLATYLRIHRQTLLILGLFFTLPATGYLIAASTKLSARVRERQLSLLAIIGVQERHLRRALMLETAVLVGAGAALGLTVAISLFNRLEPHFVAWTAFPGDFAIPVWAYLAVLLVVLSTAVCASWWGAESWRRRTGTGVTSQPRKRQVWRWVLLMASLVVAMASTWLTLPVQVVLAGRAMTVGGLLAVAAPLCASAGERLHPSDSSLTSLAGARLRSPAGALTRSLAALTAGLFVLSVGATTIQSRSDDPAAIQRAQSADGLSVVEVRRPNAVTEETLRTYQVLSGRSSTDGGYIATVTGPCPTLRAAIGSDRISCSHSLFGVYSSAQRAPQGVTATPTVLSGPRADVLTGYVINPADKSAIAPGDDIVLVPLPTAAAESLYDRLVGQDPITNVRINGTAVVSGASELIGILDVFRWGALFAVTIALISALTSLVSLMYDRQPGNNYLQILGLSPRQAAGLTLIEVGAAAAACTALSLFCSWLWAVPTRTSEHPVGLLSVASPFLIGLLVLMGAATAIVSSSLRTAGVTVIPDRDNLTAAHDTFRTSRRDRQRSGRNSDRSNEEQGH